MNIWKKKKKDDWEHWKKTDGEHLNIQLQSWD